LQDDLRGFANPIHSEVRTPEMLTQLGRSRAQRCSCCASVFIALPMLNTQPEM
jgi:hypothetical protein